MKTRLFIKHVTKAKEKKIGTILDKYNAEDLQVFDKGVSVKVNAGDVYDVIDAVNAVEYGIIDVWEE